MRSVSTAVRLVGLLVVLAMVVPVTYADDPPPPFYPPEARISPPGGVAAPEPTFFELLIDWLRAQARTLPRVG
jgi:hypothetical protein